MKAKSLVALVACLTMALLLFLGTPPSATLTADQINQLPLWGP
jgi:hypothetical protein